MCSNGHLIEKAYGKGLPSGLAFWEKGDFYFILFRVIFFLHPKAARRAGEVRDGSEGGSQLCGDSELEHL